MVAERRGTVFLLLGMLAWVVAGFVVALIAAAVLGAGSALQRRLSGVAGDPAPDQLIYILIAAAAFQGTLLLGALWQGRRAGDGDRRVGLGFFLPVNRPGRVVWLCAVMIIWLLAFILAAEAFPALRDFAKSVTPNVLTGLGDGGPVGVTLKVVLVVVLAPLSEELFFRGWLWEALRRRGHAIITTAGLTALPWLLLHGIDSPGRILFLIPAAVVFSLARHQGGSVVASLAVHVTNNTAAVSMQALSTWFGQG